MGCGCKKKRNEQTVAESKVAADDRTSKLEAMAELSVKKIQDGGKLRASDICIYCKQNIVYYCKDGCIVTGETYEEGTLGF